VLPLLWVLVAAVVLTLALIWLLQRRLIYFPTSTPVPAAATILPTAEQVSFDTEDDARLGAWWLPPARASRDTVIVFHGNAGDRSHRAPLADVLTRAGYGVLLFDYRGYGGNPGEPSETGLAADARAARAYVDSRPDVDRSRVVYFGESLGAAVAVSLAIEKPPKALILRSPFTSLADMGRIHYPFLPTGPLLRDRYESISRIDQVACPILILAGERDTIIPAEVSRRLYEGISRGDAQFVLIPGADHNDFELLAGKQLIEEVLRFVER
jgi:fermentation-respiration switch protein FrsA (DUF1100 family)